MDILIRQVHIHDIPVWWKLSREYDKYVRELVFDLYHWYEGNENDSSFTDYMISKIKKEEAFMAMNSEKACLGIVAFSRANNSITFIGIFHHQDFDTVGKCLMDYAINHLSTEEEISVNVIKSNSEYVEKERLLMKQYGFVYSNNDIENGVPVDKMIRPVST